MSNLEQEIEELIAKGENPLRLSLAELIAKLAIIFEKLNLLKGESGIQGEKGDKGDRGEIGPRGIQGIMGPMGLTGKDGKDGEPGLSGKDGIGLAGKDGLNGKDALITDELKTELINAVLEKVPRPQGQRLFGGVRMPTYIDETPNGAINGSNVTFTLSTAPKQNSEIVRLNGLVMELTEDYTFVNRTITFVTAPVTGSRVRVKYEKF